MIWLQFIISALIILIAGIQLTKFADELSEALCLGKLWIGVVLLGLITSLPEAGSSIVSVAMLQAGDLAVGNVVGSNNFNLLLIVLLDIGYRRDAITNVITYSRAQFVSAMFALVLSIVVVLEISLAQLITLPSVFGVGFGSMALVVLYFWGMRRVYVTSDHGCGIEDVDERRNKYSLLKIYSGLVISALCVVGAAVFLANAADEIAQATGWGRTFVGSLFLAMSTSLPEMVVTFSALRIGQADLAIGNIFGSNMTNMFLLSLCDPFVRAGSLLQHVSTAHIFTASAGFILTWIVLAGLRQQKKYKILGMGWDSWMILAVYAAWIVGLYLIK